jgi:hypothetical protein
MWSLPSLNRHASNFRCIVIISSLKFCSQIYSTSPLVMIPCLRPSPGLLNVPLRECRAPSPAVRYVVFLTVFVLQLNRRQRAIVFRQQNSRKRGGGGAWNLVYFSLFFLSLSFPAALLSVLPEPHCMNSSTKN